MICVGMIGRRVRPQSVIGLGLMTSAKLLSRIVRTLNRKIASVFFLPLICFSECPSAGGAHSAHATHLQTDQQSCSHEPVPDLQIDRIDGNRNEISSTPRIGRSGLLTEIA